MNGNVSLLPVIQQFRQEHGRVPKMAIIAFDTVYYDGVCEFISRALSEIDNMIVMGVAKMNTPFIGTVQYYGGEG